MKKKIILMTLISLLLSIVIYLYTKSDEINIVALGDGLSLGMTPYNIEGYSFNDYLKEEYITNHKLKNYIYEFANAGITTKELIYEIKENKTITINNETIEIQRAINEADILTIAIGMDELSQTSVTTQIKNEYKEDMEELLSMISVLNHNKVIILGLYQTSTHDALTTEKLNAIIRDIALSNNFIFVDINKTLNNPDYYLDSKSYYINYLGHKAIYQEIKKML